MKSPPGRDFSNHGKGLSGSTLICWRFEFLDSKLVPSILAGACALDGELDEAEANGGKHPTFSVSSVLPTQ